MTPLKLTLRGFRGIKSGQGKDELVLDLSSIEGALIALTGPNGAGKTTVMDNLTPYRLMPSRATAYSVDSFSYYDHVLPPEASKELFWSHDGTVYRSTLLFRQPGKTQKTEAYLHVGSSTDGPWQAYQDGALVSDGKTGTYDACIEHILGPAELYFTAAFSAQGRKSLSNYSNGEIKNMLTDLLGLEKIRTLGESAKVAVTGRKASLETLQSQIARVADAEPERERATADRAAAEAKSTGLEAERSTARQRVQAATRALSEAQATASKQAEIEARRAELRRQLDGTRAAHAQRRAGLVSDQAAAMKALDGTRAAIQAENTSAAGSVAHLRQQIASNRTVLERRVEIEGAAAEVQRLTVDADRHATEAAAAKADVTAIMESKDKAAAIQRQMDHIASAGKEVAGRCERATERGELCNQVPCVGTDLQPRCPLLADALQARALAPGFAAQAEAKREEWRVLDGQRAAVEPNPSALDNARAKVTAAETAERATRQKLQQATALAAQAPMLAQAQEAIAAAEAQITEVETKRAVRVAELEDAAYTQRVRHTEIGAQLEQMAEAEAEETRSIEAAIAALPASAAHATEQAERELAAADAALEAVERAIAQAREDIASATARIRVAEERMASVAQVRAEADATAADIGQWELLAKALGPNGIIALSIDDAGPTLSALTNDLLTECYGPRFTVRIDTQEQTKAGTIKEVFGITVFDADTDSDKALEQMSGGERVWIQEAITRAIALYQAQSSGRHYECLFTDESDGALDADKKQQFIRMKRRVLELGNYQREIFISHSPELWDMADHVIRL